VILYLIEKEFAHRTSDAWKHYRITVSRQAGVITFIFHCKHSNLKHPEYTRKRSKLKQGNSALGDAAKKCDQAMAVPIATALALCVFCSQWWGLCADFSQSI
jgi:hypothetical protein